MNGETKHPMSFPIALSDGAMRLLTGPDWQTVREICAAEREACAQIADQHRGSAAKKRRAKGQMLGRIDNDGAVVEIQAEERGEDIAAEIIAHEIRARS